MNEKFLKKMFGTSHTPVIRFTLSEISKQAQKLAGQLSISGVQPKLSVKLDKKENALVTVTDKGQFILKPQTSVFPGLPENEQCCMDIAEQLQIETPLHCLLPLKDRSLAYVVKRFDRKNKIKIHQEDFAQILEADDKYKGSAEQIGRKLKELSSAPGYDCQLFFERLTLNFILGNGDAHLKNYSISYKEDGARLSPAYDIVSSKLFIPEEADSALSINGKKNRLKLADFDALAEYLNIPIKIRYEKFSHKFNLIKKIVESSSLKHPRQQELIEIIKERLRRLNIAQ